MSRGIQAINQSSVSKAIKGTRNAGLDINRLRFDLKAGILVIEAGKPGESERVIVEDVSGLV
jgi:hypothetical protein